MNVRELGVRPGLARMYARAVTVGLLGAGDGLPDFELLVRDVDVEPARLAKYREVCGFRRSDTIPVPYLHVLSFPMALRLMTDRAFPLRVPGLVHVENRLRQHRPVAADEPISVRVRSSGLGTHEKGTRFDLVGEARVGDETVWEEKSTYLRRGDDSGASAADDEGADAADGQGPSADDGAASRPHTTFRAGASVSTRYAGVSGDRNPHHLHPLLARLFGFPRLLAHGMWMNARALAGIEDRLPERFSAEVAFDRPMLLPTTVKLEVAEQEGGLAIALRDEESDTPNMSGVVRWP
jgi:acyl dehydratase